MKYLILFLPLLFGCLSDEKGISKAKTDEATIEPPKAESFHEFTKYSTVLEMLVDARDFSEEQGTLKILSEVKQPLHIQVSKPVFDGDLDINIIEQTKRDLVYVAFQSFAQTDISELTITSVPIETQGIYKDKYKLTRAISRKRAEDILSKYLNTENFQDLFEFDGTSWIPSEKFDVLKFSKLDQVFADLN